MGALSAVGSDGGAVGGDFGWWGGECCGGGGEPGHCLLSYFVEDLVGSCRGGDVIEAVSVDVGGDYECDEISMEEVICFAKGMFLFWWR